MQWGLSKVTLRQHQWNRDRGWLQSQAQEEAAKLWVREGIQVLGIACWHVRALEQNDRRVVHAQVQPEWAHAVEAEKPTGATSWEMGSLLGQERAEPGAIQERAMLVLVMEAAAARRRLGQLPTQSCWGGGGPLRAGRVEGRGPPRGCSAAYPGTDGTTNAGAQRYATASRKLPTATGFGQRYF